MINSIKLLNTPEHSFNYLTEDTRNAQVRGLYKKLEKGIEFKTGINILIGENGSGKSTVLNILRKANLLEHSFIPEPKSLPFATLDSLSEVYDNFEIEQDFRYAVFNLYRLSEDHKALGSNDLLMRDRDSVSSFVSLKEESKGQNLMGDLNVLFNWMFERSSECFPMLYYLGTLKESFSEKSIISSNCLTAPEILGRIKGMSITTVDPIFTILMDEPDQGLDIDNLKEIFEIVSLNKPNTQLISVIHNPILIYKLSKLDYVNIIEMSDGYLKKIQNFIETD